MASEGTIICHTYVSNALLPIEGATLIFTQTADDETERIIAVRRTDSSGKTEPVTVQTPDADRSQHSVSSGPRAWAAVSILAAHPEYIREEARNVQVFPDIITYQDFAMLPRAALSEQGDPTESFETPAQNL